MASVEELKLDLEEYKKLCEQSTRNRVKSTLNREITNIEAEIKLKEKQAAAKSDPVTNSAASSLCVTKIFNYAWDQSDKFVKLYVTLDNIHTQASDAVSTTFTQRTMEFQAIVNSKVHALKITNFAHDIKPAESHHKVKQDMVVLFLRKDQPKKWACVTALEVKAKEAKMAKPSKDEEDNPSKSIMSLMKQMYDDGDDDMKRTIAKAWTEARDKKEPMEI